MEHNYMGIETEDTTPWRRIGKWRCSSTHS